MLFKLKVNKNPDILVFETIRITQLLKNFQVQLETIQLNKY